MTDGLNPQIPLKYDEHKRCWVVRYSITHIGSILNEVLKWCWATFGHPGTNHETGAYSGWDYHGGWIYFYDEKCVTMYSLRWA